tara:strand:+ start:260 stop:889 length:630 start_codon:yes stop_codon:yes gene_type:complete
MQSASLKNGLFLAVFATLCAMAVSLTYLVTQDKIELAQQRALEKTLNQIIPKDMYDNNLYQSCIKVSHPDLLGHQTEHKVYIAKKEDTAVALAIETLSHEGYSGDIHLVLAVDMQRQILGVRTLEHQETPGLGDKIDIQKSDWVESFKGLSYIAQEDNMWAVKKDGGDFDQFTGATITPRAYVKAIKNTLIYLKNHENDLFVDPVPCRG